MSALLEMAERCEAAEGPDRELDAEIVCATDRRPAWLQSQEGVLWVDRTARHPVVRFAYSGVGVKSMGNPSVDEVPHFTASLDAAMSLVPEGLEWELFGYDPKRDPRFGPFQARIKLLRYEDDPEELGPEAIANGHTPALALTAAALRALASESQQ